MRNDIMVYINFCKVSSLTLDPVNWRLSSENVDQINTEALELNVLLGGSCVPVGYKFMHV